MRVIAGLILLAAGCGLLEGDEDCGPFPDWSASEYLLSYPIGTVITASRAGIVTVSVGHCVDGDGNCTNQVAVRHPDGTTMVCSHLTEDGVLVPVGATVQAGDTIARSGDTGYTGGWPHLHHSLHPCADVSEPAGSCPSIPLTFSNTQPNPEGLTAKRTYPAYPPQ